MTSESAGTVLPTKLYREDEQNLVIEWADGKRHVYSWRLLRDHCPCAGCREERAKPPDPFRVLSANELVPLAPQSMVPVGRYAYKITWSDGHDSGIFTLEHLRELGEQSSEKSK